MGSRIQGTLYAGTVVRGEVVRGVAVGTVFEAIVGWQWCMGTVVWEGTTEGQYWRPVVEGQ